MKFVFNRLLQCSSKSLSIAFLLFFVFSGFNHLLSQDAPCEPYDFPLPPASTDNTLCGVYGNSSFELEIGAGSSSGITKASDLVDGTLANKTIRIVGTFTVDKNCFFENIVARINPSVSIYLIGQGRKFEVRNSKLFACDGLWEGINMTSSSQQVHVLDQSRIEDARYAIRAEQQKRATILVENSDFNRNVYGIYLVGGTGFAGAEMPQITHLVNSSFRASSMLNTGATPRAGIFTKDVMIPLKNDTAHNNQVTFSRTTRGISSTGSKTIVYVLNHTYLDMSQAGVYTDDVNVTYIRSSNFTDCRRGISFTNSVKLDCQKTDFFTLSSSAFNREQVFCESFKAGNFLKIKNCNFNISGENTAGNASGIYLKPGMSKLAGEIIGANFTLTNPSSPFATVGNSIGLNIYGNMMVGSDLDVSKNTFNVNHNLPYGNIGLYMAGGTERHGLFFILNFFNCSGRAIVIEGGANELVDYSGSEITESYFNPQTLGQGWGMEINGSESLKICSNFMKANSLNASYRFNGQCMSTDFVDNITYSSGFTNLNNLFLIENEAFISPQLSKANKWYPALIDGTLYRPYLINGNVIKDLIYLSKFSVGEPQSEYNSATQTYTQFYPTHPDRIVPDNGIYEDAFFDDEGDPGNPGCVTQFVNVADLADLAVATGSIDNLWSGAAVAWDARQGLFRKLKRDPLYVQTHPAFASFLNMHQNGNIGHFYQFDWAFNHVYSPSLALVSQMDSVELVLAAKYAALYGTPEDSMTAEALMNEINGLLSVWNNLNELVVAERQQRISVAAQSLEAVVPATTYEYNKKIVSELMVLKALNPDIEWNDVQLEILVDIAQQCMEEGGKIVETARSLLPSCALDLIKTQIAPCRLAPQERGVKKSESASVSEVNVAPNPAYGNIRVLVAQPAEMSVYSVSGTLEYKESLNSGDHVLVLNLKPGLYFLHFRLTDGSYAVKKLLML